MNNQINIARLLVITVYHGKKNDAKYKNRAQYLYEAIRSVESLHSPNVIQIIIDDGSTDTAIAEAVQQYPESSCRKYFRREKLTNEPLSSTNARNHGLALCLQNQIPGVQLTARDYITFLDSDDLAIDFAGRLSYLKKHRLDFCVTDSLIFFDDDVAYTWQCVPGALSKVRRNFWVHGKMPYPTMTWRLGFLKEMQRYLQKVYGRMNFFDGSIGCGEDVDVAYVTIDYVQQTGARYEYWDKITTAYRIHDTSLAVIRNQRRRRQEENMVLIRHNGRIGSCILHLRRMLARPECYLSSLGFLAGRRKKPYSKSEFIPKEFTNI